MEGESVIGELMEGDDPMKKQTRCACGRLLQGRQRVYCSECYVRQHSGSMQCPWRWCLRWYISHGGSAYVKECLYHSTGACKTMTYDEYLKRNRKAACVS